MDQTMFPTRSDCAWGGQQRRDCSSVCGGQQSQHCSVRDGQRASTYDFSQDIQIAGGSAPGYHMDSTIPPSSVLTPNFSSDGVIVGSNLRPDCLIGSNGLHVSSFSDLSTITSTIFARQDLTSHRQSAVAGMNAAADRGSGIYYSTNLQQVQPQVSLPQFSGDGYQSRRNHRDWNNTPQVNLDNETSSTQSTCYSPSWGHASLNVGMTNSTQIRPVDGFHQDSLHRTALHSSDSRIKLNSFSQLPSASQNGSYRTSEFEQSGFVKRSTLVASTNNCPSADNRDIAFQNQTQSNQQSDPSQVIHCGYPTQPYSQYRDPNQTSQYGNLSQSSQNSDLSQTDQYGHQTQGYLQHRDSDQRSQYINMSQASPNRDPTLTSSQYTDLTQASQFVGCVNQNQSWRLRKIADHHESCDLGQIIQNVPFNVRDGSTHIQRESYTTDGQAGYAYTNMQIGYGSTDKQLGYGSTYQQHGYGSTGIQLGYGSANNPIGNNGAIIDKKLSSVEEKKRSCNQPYQREGLQQQIHQTSNDSNR